MNKAASSKKRRKTNAILLDDNAVLQHRNTTLQERIEALLKENGDLRNQVNEKAETIRTQVGEI